RLVRRPARWGGAHRLEWRTSVGGAPAGLRRPFATPGGAPAGQLIVRPRGSAGGGLAWRRPPEPADGGGLGSLEGGAGGGGGGAVDLDQQAGGGGRQRRQRHRRHVVALASAVAGVDQDRQVRQVLDRRDHRQVERVAAVVREGADAALAQDDVVVAAGHHV